jgi:hypothetical protein
MTNVYGLASACIMTYVESLLRNIDVRLRLMPLYDSLIDHDDFTFPD